MMFKIACGALRVGGWGFQPSEFWNMTPPEWWQLYDFNVGADVKERADEMKQITTIFNKLTKNNPNRKAKRK